MEGSLAASFVLIGHPLFHFLDRRLKRQVFQATFRRFSRQFAGRALRPQFRLDCSLLAFGGRFVDYVGSQVHLKVVH